LSDGRVEVVVQGEEDKVDLLKSLILRGNGFSIVRYIEEEDLPIGEYGEFHVEY
jgi:acylphosphatase